MNNAIQKIEQLKTLKAEMIRKKIEENEQKCIKRKLKLQTLYEGRKNELKKLIDLKIKLATERKILARLKFQNEIEKKVSFLELKKKKLKLK